MDWRRNQYNYFVSDLSLSLSLSLSPSLSPSLALSLSHHKVSGILVDSLPHLEYTKIVNISSTKSIFESLCSTYEGNQQVKEAKANQLVHQYELYRMKKMKILKSCTQGFKLLCLAFRF